MAISTDLLFMEPVFHGKIWGGRKLEEMYGYDIPDGPVGECWGISAHPNGDCRIASGPLAGMFLSQAWSEHPELFGGLDGDRFPLLVKILDATDDLSVQVHPGDAYAAEHENGSLGKTECWYVIDCDDDATIIVGQRAASREELAAAIEQGRWDEVLNEIPIHPGDFFQIDAGTVHAIKRGTVILETQQSSDVTYRLYDYDRRQDDGSLRELHIDKSLDVVDYGAKAPETGEVAAPEVDGVTHLVDCPAYSVDRVYLDGELTYPVASAGIPFLCVTVMAGEGSVNGSPLKAGDHFIATSTCDGLLLEGCMTLIASHI